MLALGLVLIFKAQDMVQFGYGEFFMAGAFIGFVCYVTLGLPYPVAFLVAIACGAVLGLCAERFLIRPIADSPHVTLVMATVGMSFLIKGVARIWFNQDIYVLPPVFGGDPIPVLGTVIAPQSILVIVTSFAFMLALLLLFKFTAIGKQMRATADNLTGARMVGVNVGLIFATTWGISSAMGAAAGMLAAPLTLLYPDMGTRPLLKAFAAAVLGGFGSVPGAIVSALAIGVCELYIGVLVGSQTIDVLTFAIIMVVIVLRPKGLFGTADAKRL
jgi:branched-chain amino acid transport system permease protein